jgi:hypothetical protein
MCVHDYKNTKSDGRRELRVTGYLNDDKNTE